MSCSSLRGLTVNLSQGSVHSQRSGSAPHSQVLSVFACWHNGSHSGVCAPQVAKLCQPTQGDGQSLLSSCEDVESVALISAFLWGRGLLAVALRLPRCTSRHDEALGATLQGVWPRGLDWRVAAMLANLTNQTTNSIGRL